MADSASIPTMALSPESARTMHLSIKEKGDELKCTAVSPFVLGCPLCPKFNTKSASVIHRHLLSHEANAVHFNEKVICRCNLPCRDGGHFHCPFCGTTIIRKDTITMHLIECKNKSDMAQPTSVPPSQPPSPETHPAVLSVTMEHSYLLPPSVSAVKIDHSYIQTKSPKTPAVATDLTKDQEAPAEPDLPLSPTTTTSEDPIAPENKATGDVPPTHVKCPHCPLVLYKKNLLVHVKRKHGQLQAMEDKPWALISEVGAPGYPEEVMDIMRKRFQLVCYQDFLQNLQLYSPRIQVMFSWNASPAAEPSLLRSLPSLKVVASGGAGVNHLDVPYINSLGVKVTNTPGVVSSATADIALGLLLASARDIVTCHQIAVDPTTTILPTTMMGVDVTGSTMGIVGMGDIGYKVAQRGRGFEMKILYHNRRRRSVKEEQAVGATYCQSLDELLTESDFVVLAVNLTPETTGLISCRELSLMKSTATLVNISRGLVVDQDALVEALQSGTIRGAALDVTHPEPLPRDHPLLGLPNVVITPHIGTNTIKTCQMMVESMVNNALAVLTGQPIPNEVRAE